MKKIKVGNSYRYETTPDESYELDETGYTEDLTLGVCITRDADGEYRFYTASDDYDSLKINRG